MLMGPRAPMIGLAAMLPPGIEQTSKSQPRRCPLLEVKRTWSGFREMSAYDPKRTSAHCDPLEQVRCHTLRHCPQSVLGVEDKL